MAPRRLLRALGLGALVGIGTACVPADPLVIRPDFIPPSSSSISSVMASGGCRLRFLKVVDQRGDKVAMGSVAGRPVRSPQDTDAWIRNVLKGLPAKGVEVSFEGAGTPGQPGLEAEAQLVTAWVTSLATSMSANVVMRMRYHRADGSVEERVYRGYETSVNWSSGDGEIQSILDEAFSKALDKVAADAMELSRPAPPKAEQLPAAK